MSSEWVMIIMQVLHCLDLFSPVLRSVPAIILRDQPSCCQLRCPVTAPCHHSLFPFLSHTPYAQPTQVPWWHEVKSLWPWNFIAESHRSRRCSLFYTTQHRWDFSGTPPRNCRSPGACHRPRPRVVGALPLQHLCGAPWKSPEAVSKTQPPTKRMYFPVPAFGFFCFQFRLLL